MKKVLFALATVFALGFAACVRPVQAGGVYDGIAPGESIIGVKLGLSNTVGANVTYDYSLARVWKGSFTIGGQVGYMWEGQHQNINGVKYSYNWNMLDFKVRTTYRFSVVVPEWEVYAGVGLGGGVSLYSDKVKGVGNDLQGKTKANYGFFSGSFILGTSYNFNEMLGVNLEFDFGNWEQSWVNIGLNIKL